MITIVALLCATLASGVVAAPRDPVPGLWRTGDKDNTAEIYEYSDKICTKLIYLKSVNESDTNSLTEKQRRGMDFLVPIGYK